MTYELAADDYGVMRLSATTVKAANEAFADRSDVMVQKALERLVEIGLVAEFTHQGRRYCFQTDWQNYQRVKHPRDTMQPLPPDAIVNGLCTSATKKLYMQHPSKRPEELHEDFGKVSEIVPEPLGNISDAPQTEKSELGSLACARTRETANGKRLMANGSSEGGLGETPPPMDIWARELIRLYPPQGRCGWNLVERPLFDALAEAPDGPAAAWERLKQTLERHSQSHQWRVKQMIPRIDKWLREGLYLQELPAHPVSTLVTEKTARTLSSAAQFAKGDGRG